MAKKPLTQIDKVLALLTKAGAKGVLGTTLRKTHNVSSPSTVIGRLGARGHWIQTVAAGKKSNAVRYVLK